MNISEQIKIILEEVIRKEIPPLLNSRLKNIETNSSAKTEPELINIDVVVSLTGYAKQTIYGLVSTGKIPYIKRPGSKFLRFRKSEIIEWLENKQ